MFRDAIGVVAALLSIAGLTPYIYDVVRRRTRPHLFTWIIWSVMTWIAFAAQVTGGGGPGAWATGTSALLCIPIVIAALFDGEKEIRALDWLSLAAAMLAGIAWAINHDPTVSVVLVSFIDAVAFLPTIRKSIRKPEQETLANYVMSGAKHALSIVALSRISIVTGLYPAVVGTMNVVVIAVLITRRRALGTNLPRTTATIVDVPP